MSAKLVAGVDNYEALRGDDLAVPEPVVATLQRFVIEQRSGSVTLSFRGGDLRIIKVEEIAPAK